MDYAKLHDKLIMKAWKDPKFKQNLLKEPQKTIAAFVKAETGHDLPAGVKFHVIEDKPNTRTLVLPPSPEKIVTMSDTELRKVAGGRYMYTDEQKFL